MVTVLAVVFTATAAPVVLAALLSVRVKSSGPSIRLSSVSDRSNTTSAIEAPSDGDLNINVPVAASRFTSGLLTTARLIAAIRLS